MTTLAERLGHPADARLLIITAAGLGGCHAMNDGVYESIRSGLATGASLQVPAPWAREAAARYRGEDVGVELTLNAEFELYRWAPLTHAPSLLGGDGGFPSSVADLWDHADTEEVRRECRAQIERAILWGFDITHLGAHLGALVPRPELFDVYLEMAVDFRLPIRLLDPHLGADVGFPAAEIATDEGIVFVDHVVSHHGFVGNGRYGRAVFERALLALAPGVTEIQLHPSADRPEIRAISPDWAERVGDHHALTIDAEMRMLVERSGATLISYASLRAAMRS